MRRVIIGKRHFTLGNMGKVKTYFFSRFYTEHLVWFGLVWFGLVWFGLVWFGLVWFGLVWFGLVA